MKKTVLSQIGLVFFQPFTNLLAPESGQYFLSADSLQKHERLFITPYWKYHAGDDSTWASPKLDDSAWEIVKTDSVLPNSWIGRSARSSHENKKFTEA